VAVVSPLLEVMNHIDGRGAVSMANILHASHQQTTSGKAAVEPVDLFVRKPEYMDMANPTARNMNQQQAKRAINADSSPTERTSADLLNACQMKSDSLKIVPSFLRKPLRPQSAMKYYMRYLTDFEHQEIFEYSEVCIEHIFESIRRSFRCACKLSFDKPMIDFWQALMRHS
jgi:hypothetical protein